MTIDAALNARAIAADVNVSQVLEMALYRMFNPPDPETLLEEALLLLKQRKRDNG